MLLLGRLAAAVTYGVGHLARRRRRSEPAPRARAPRVTLKAGRDKSLRQRHPWIFSGAIERVDGMPASRR